LDVATQLSSHNMQRL